MNKHLFSVTLLVSAFNTYASDAPASPAADDSASAIESSINAESVLATAGVPYTDSPRTRRKRHNAVKPKTAARHWHADDEAIIQNPFAEKDEEGTTGSSTASSGHTSPAPQAVNLGFAAASSDSATADDTVVTAAEALAAASTSALPADAALTPEFVDKFQTLLTAAHEHTTTPADDEIDLDAHDAQDPKTEKVD